MSEQTDMTLIDPRFMRCSGGRATHKVITTTKTRGNSQTISQRVVPLSKPKPLTHEQLVHAVLSSSPPLTAAELRREVHKRYDVWIEGVTAAVRRLRGHGVDAPCERGPGGVYRYRLASKEPA